MFNKQRDTKGKSGHIPTSSRLIQPLSKRGSGFVIARTLKLTCLGEAENYMPPGPSGFQILTSILYQTTHFIRPAVMSAHSLTMVLVLNQRTSSNPSRIKAEVSKQGIFSQTHQPYDVNPGYSRGIPKPDDAGNLIPCTSCQWLACNSHEAASWSLKLWWRGHSTLPYFQKNWNHLQNVKRKTINEHVIFLILIPFEKQQKTTISDCVLFLYII